MSFVQYPWTNSRQTGYVGWHEFVDTMPFAALPVTGTRQQTMAMEPPISGRMASAAGRSEKHKRQPWQIDAYRHATDLGELGYFLTLISNTTAKGSLVVTEQDEHGVAVQPDKDDDGNPQLTPDQKKAERVLNAFRGPEGDHHALIAAGTVHDQIAGEGILIGSPVPKTKGFAWELVSVLEVVEDPHTGKKMRKRSATRSGVLSVADPTNAEDVLGDDTYTSRYHRADWGHSGDATSALRRNAAACREAILWTQLIHTTIRSRLAAGVLLTPEEVDFPPDENQPDIEGVDRFLEMLISHMSAPKVDPESAASIVPLVAAVRGDMIDKFKLLSLTDDSMDISVMLEARAVALKRVAAGMDGPLEIMEGLGDTSHWNSAGIDTDFVKKHIIPLGERLARFFTVRYFRRMLIELEEMDEATAERFTLAYDGAEILTRVDAANSADALWRDRLISDDTRVEAHGFDPDATRPSDEERQQRLLAALAVTPSVNNRILLSALLDMDMLAEDIDPELLEQFLAPPDNTPTEEPEPTEDDPDETPEPPVAGGPDVPAVGEPTPADELATMERVRTHASATLDRAIEKAANHVVSQRRRMTEPTRAAIDKPAFRSWPRKAEALRMLTPADWDGIGADPNTLFAGAWDDFNGQVVAWLRDMHLRAGADPAVADNEARAAATQICHQLDDLALAALRGPLAREDGLSVPLALVARPMVAR